MVSGPVDGGVRKNLGVQVRSRERRGCGAVQSYDECGEDDQRDQDRDDEGAAFRLGEGGWLH